MADQGHKKRQSISLTADMVEDFKKRAVESSVITNGQHAANLSSYIEWLIVNDMRSRKFRKGSIRNPDEPKGDTVAIPKTVRYVKKAEKKAIATKDLNARLFGRS